MKTSEYPFPGDATDPIAAIAGHEHQDQTDGWLGSHDFDAKLVRVGD